MHIYRFVSHDTIEENLLRKANQKRSLDDVVIQKGEFDWSRFFSADDDTRARSASALQKALVEFEDFEDSHAAKVAASEEAAILGEDRNDFGDVVESQIAAHGTELMPLADEPITDEQAAEEAEEEAGTVTDYMLRIVRSDRDFFKEMTLR